jgi:hypothetical protein
VVAGKRARNGGVICMTFEYSAPAKLYMPTLKGIGRRAATRYRRFGTSSFAFRSAPPPPLARGCKSERSDWRFIFDGAASQTLGRDFAVAL